MDKENKEKITNWLKELSATERVLLIMIKNREYWFYHKRISLQPFRITDYFFVLFADCYEVFQGEARLNDSGNKYLSYEIINEINDFENAIAGERIVDVKNDTRREMSMKGGQ